MKHMKANDPSDKDAALSGFLKHWKVAAPLPPHFQEQVWRRIEHQEAQSPPVVTPWTLLRSWVANVLPRPALAVAYVAVLLAAGAGIGWTRAQHEALRVSSQLSQRYVKTVDPFQALP